MTLVNELFLIIKKTTHQHILSYFLIQYKDVRLLTSVRTRPCKKIPIRSFYSPQRLYPCPYLDVAPHSVLATAAFTRSSLKHHPPATLWLPHPAPRSILRCAVHLPYLPHPYPHPTHTAWPRPSLRRHYPAGRLRRVRAVGGDESAAAAHNVGDGLGDGAPHGPL
jgi:hypothetical protein